MTSVYRETSCQAYQSVFGPGQSPQVPYDQRLTTVLPSIHHPMKQGILGRVLVSAGSNESAYLSRTPRKGARLSFWATTRTLDGGASTMLARDSFIGLSRCSYRCWGNGLIASKERNKNLPKAFNHGIGRSHVQGP